MTTITKERVEWLTKISSRDEIDDIGGDEIRELARIALASLEAEPALYAAEETLAYANMGELHLTCLSEPMGDAVIPLYTAPPAPVVPPDEATPEKIEILASTYAPRGVTYQWDDDECNAAADSWNACRAAMIKGSQLVSKREKVRRDHAEWSDATFGNVGPVGPLKHLSKEALEAAADPSDPLEWADMQFLLWDAQRRMGLSDEFITRAMIEKLEINKARQWPEPKDGEPRLHIKEQSESVLPEIECDICGHVSTDPEGRHHCCEDNSNDC